MTTTTISEEAFQGFLKGVGLVLLGHSGTEPVLMVDQIARSITNLLRCKAHGGLEEWGIVHCDICASLKDAA